MWTNPYIRVFGRDGNLFYQSYEANILEAGGGSTWHEIGPPGYVVLAYFDPDAMESVYQIGRRVVVTVYSERGQTSHRVCDFIIESIRTEEISLATGGVGYSMRLEGRPQALELTYYSVDRRCISRRGDSAENAAAVTKNSLTMSATDRAGGINTNVNLAGWTVEMADGAWSQIVAHDQAAGVLTIDPEWSSYKAASGDNPESGIPPATQTWQVYGGLMTNPTGDNTDLKQVMGFVGGGWRIHPIQSEQSTAAGTLTTPNGATALKALQVIAQQSGEYFRVIQGERSLQWMRGIPWSTHPQYGGTLTIMTGSVGSSWHGIPLPGASLQVEGYETVTRVRPTGDGGGDNALSLKDLPTGFAAASGYAIDGEYLVWLQGETMLGTQQARDVTFPLIGQANDGAISKAVAAQALYNAALVWLKEHTGPRKIVQMTVDSPIPIFAVEQVFATATPPWDELPIRWFVIEAATVYSEGQLTYRLTLSDKKSPYMTDERLIAEALVATGTGTRSGTQNNNVLPRNSLRMGGTKTVVESGGGDGGDGGVTDHGALTGLGDNDHPQYTLATTYNAHAGNPSAHHAPVTAANASVAVSGQAVSVQLAGTSGLTTTATGIALADTLAGQGLSITNKVLNIGAPTDSGLVVGGDAIALGTPGTLNTTSTNAVSGGSHFHAVTNTSNAKTTPNTILRGDTNGDVSVRFATMDKAITPEIETATGNILLDPASSIVQVDGNLSFVGARVISSDTGAVTMAPAAGLVLDPSGDVVTVNPTVTLQTNHHTSGFLGNGWQVQYDGNAEFRKIQADELHVQAFIADTARVQVGETWVTPSMALLSRTFTVPGVGQSSTTANPFVVEDAPGLADLPVFADDDWVLLRIVDRAGGGLVVANVWGQVTNYVDLNTDGEQRWTWTTRYSSIAISNFRAQRGAVVLSFGKAGSGWVRTTTLDTQGSPYMGISTWSGANPYTAGNRRELVRLGQLSGITGVPEWGMRAGMSDSNHVTFTDLRSEIHNARLSLYAGNNATLRVGSVLVTLNGSVVIRPNADVASFGAVSSGTSFFSTIDETTNSYTDYVANEPNRSAYVTVGLTNPSFTSLNSVTVRAYTQGRDFSTVAPIDTIYLYAQVFAADGITPLTAEVLLREATSATNADSGLVAFPQYDAKATATQWAGAVLRMRWEYETNVASEVIRLDPAQPSIAVGSPLPTGIADGGDGFWVGRAIDGVYKLRLGAASGASLRYDGSNLLLRDSAGVDVIRLTNTGASEFAGPMTIGLTGGIWQGAGTFASPTRGIKLFSENVANVGPVGRLATYNGGTLQISVNTDGSLTAGAGAVKLDAAGITLTETALSQTAATIDGTLGLAFNATTAEQGVRAVNWRSDGIVKSYIIGSRFSSYDQLLMRSTTTAGRASALLAEATAPSGTPAFVTVSASSSSLRASLRLDSPGVGSIPTIVANMGTFTLDQGAADSPILKTQSSDIAHGMTAVTDTDTFGFLSKNNDTNGGLNVAGLGEGATGVALRGYGSTRDTTATSSTLGTVTLEGFLKSGTGVTTVDANGSLVAVKNNGLTRVIIRGNGDILSDSSTGVTLFDTYDDVAMLRSLSHVMNPEGVVRNEWDRFVIVNRAELEAAGIVDGIFVNQTALGRLLTGAVWQLHSRIAQLERRLSHYE